VDCKEGRPLTYRSELKLKVIKVGIRLIDVKIIITLKADIVLDK
jgi:hypothetical protein